MNKLAAEELVKRVRQRIAEGDCPTTPALTVEMLEHLVDHLASLPPSVAASPVAGVSADRKSIARMIAAEMWPDSPDEYEAAVEVWADPRRDGDGTFADAAFKVIGRLLAQPSAEGDGWIAWSRPLVGTRRDIVGQRGLPDGRTEYLMHNEALCNPYYVAISALPPSVQEEKDAVGSSKPERRVVCGRAIAVFGFPGKDVLTCDLEPGHGDGWHHDQTANRMWVAEATEIHFHPSGMVETRLLGREPEFDYSAAANAEVAR